MSRQSRHFEALWRERRWDALYLMLAPLLYAAYALITPPFQTFDENQHLYRAWQLSDLQLTAERRGSQSGGKLPPGLAPATLQEIGYLMPQGPRKVIVRTVSERFSLNTPARENRRWIFYDFRGAAIYSPVGYIPQVVAIWLGSAFDFSVEWTLRLGRLLNCLLCIGLVWWALTLMPFGRFSMAIIALLPPAAAGAASFGQDGIVMGTSFLLIATSLKVAAERRWTVASVIRAAASAAALTLSKFVYLPLVLIPAVPKPSGTPMRRWLIQPLASGLLSGTLLIVWMHVNARSLVTFNPSVPNISGQIHSVLQHPTAFAALLMRTFIAQVPHLWARLYTFGDSTVWTVKPAALVGTAAVFGCMFYGEDHATELTIGRRVSMLLMFGVITLFIATALFLTSTPLYASVVEGIQGRYFLPILPLPLIALMRPGASGPSYLLPLTLGLVLASHLSTLIAIAHTFYR